MFNWNKGAIGKVAGFGAPSEAFGFYVGTEGGETVEICSTVNHIKYYQAASKQGAFSILQP